MQQWPPHSARSQLARRLLPVGAAVFAFLAASVLAPPPVAALAALAALFKVTLEGGAALVSPLRRA